MSEDNKTIEEIIAISYFDTDNMNIKNHVDRYFEIKRDIINILNKYNVMWVLIDTNGFNNKDKEIERLNNIINELEKDMRETIGLLKNQNCQEISKDYFIETLAIYCSRLDGGDKE